MIYFAGDFHLGLDGQDKSSDREKKICAWLDDCSQDAQHIYLMGDLFDFWFEHKRVAPKGHVRFLAKLAEITERIPVTVFRGNHDLWMGAYLEETCGVTVLDGPLSVEHYGKRMYLHHGDGLGKGDGGYKILKSIFKNAAAQWAFARLLHPDFALQLAQGWSQKSRAQQAPPRFEQNQSEQLFKYCESLIATGDQHDFYVFGHRHLTLDLVLSNGTRYINAGTWLQAPRFARLNSQGELSLHVPY